MPILYEESFENYTEANEEPNGHWADRGGNLRVNMPNHPAPYTTYDPTGVRTGTKSMHVWAEKAWRWGINIHLRLPYGEIDEKTGAWIPPNGTGRTLANVYDLIYTEPFVPNAVIQTVLPSQYGRYHWSHDWIYYRNLAYHWHGEDLSYGPDQDSLVEARARLPTYYLPSLRDEIYTRYHFRIKNWTGSIGIQLIRIYGMDASGGLGYLCNIDSSKSEFTIYIDGVLETFRPHETIVTDTWYYIEAHYKRGNPGGVEVWFGKDGVMPTLVYSNMSLNTSATKQVHDIQVGIVDIFDYSWEQSNPDDTYAAFDMYADDWAVGTSYIGPAPVGAQAILRLRSTPVNVPVVIDGSLQGNTPNDISVNLGLHSVSVPQQVTG